MFGEEVRLSCPARGSPSVSWQWSRNGQLLDDSVEGVTLLEQGAFLQLESAGVGDSGAYTCNVSNTIGDKVFEESYTQILNVQRESGHTHIYAITMVT